MISDMDPVRPKSCSEYLQWGIYEEYLEEIASLFVTRSAIFVDKDITWEDAAYFEERVEAHVDGLAVGGPLALHCVEQFLTRDDPAEVFAAVFALACIGSEPHLQLIINRMVLSEGEVLEACGNALKLAHCGRIATKLAPLLLEENHDLKTVVLDTLGYRRDGQADQLVALLHEDAPQVVAAAAKALRKTRATVARGILRNLMAHKDLAVQREATGALLFLGDRQSLAYVSNSYPGGNAQTLWALEFLSVVGSRDHLCLLVEAITNNHEKHIAYFAMGALGNAEAVPLLIEELRQEDEGVRIIAGDALDYLTGAGLREKASVVEEIDPDELFEGEESPKPRTHEVERVSTSYQEWSHWWKQNQDNFPHEVRWRKGKPFDFGLCIEELLAPNTTFAKRERAYLELAIRSGYDIPFEPDWFVAKQQAALKKWEAWWEANNHRYLPGKWYFNGQAI